MPSLPGPAARPRAAPAGLPPTPVRPLAGASARGRAPVWVKDDGLYGRYGGNKARKLEWLLGDARRRRRRTVITGGAIGTNHGLATALYAREIGMRTVLVLVPQPRGRARPRPAPQVAGKRRRDALRRRQGAAPSPSPGRCSSRAPGPGCGLPYLILPGGSVPLGCVGYVEAGLELGRQVAAGEVPEPSHVVVALGSGGTAAGLLLGPEAGRPALAARLRPRQRPHPAERRRRRQARPPHRSA